MKPVYHKKRITLNVEDDGPKEWILDISDDPLDIRFMVITIRMLLYMKALDQHKLWDTYRKCDQDVSVSLRGAIGDDR